MSEDSDEEQEASCGENDDELDFGGNHSGSDNPDFRNELEQFKFEEMDEEYSSSGTDNLQNFKDMAITKGKRQISQKMPSPMGKKQQEKESKIEPPSVEESKTELDQDIFCKHRVTPANKYENFNHKTGYIDTFEFSWGIHGYDTFSKFMPVTTKIITAQGNHACQMTRRSYANKVERLDTTDFRNAIVFYLKEIHGVRDETFKYKKINELFSIDQKKYIKKIMCTPETVT